MPEINRVLDLGEMIAKVDARWTHSRLIVEIDGLRWHTTRAHKRHDDRRQNALVLDGWRVLRYDAWAIINEPDRVLAEIAQALLAA